MENAISKTGVAHVIKARKHVQLLQLMRVLFSTCAWSSACSNETKVTCQLKVLALVVTGDRRSMVNVPAVFVLASGVDQFLNFFVGNDVVPPARGSVHIFRIVVQVTAANFLLLL